jgi:hypothetical protein
MFGLGDPKQKVPVLAFLLIPAAYFWLAAPTNNAPKLKQRQKRQQRGGHKHDGRNG